MKTFNLVFIYIYTYDISSSISFCKKKKVNDLGEA